MTSVEAVLLLARSQLWVRETGGENCGEVVEHYLQVAHLGAGQPWCAAFVSWVGSQATARWPLPLTASCQALFEAAKHQNMIAPAPAPGAVFLLWRPKLQRFAHTGFVVEQRGTEWATIEGNTNPGGGREGYGVFARTRTFATEDRFIKVEGQ
jgi:hypothetical protein